jgi:hypothetical protein
MWLFHHRELHLTQPWQIRVTGEFTSAVKCVVTIRKDTMVRVFLHGPGSVLHSGRCGRSGQMCRQSLPCRFQHQMIRMPRFNSDESCNLSEYCITSTGTTMHVTVTVPWRDRQGLE